MMLNVAEGPRPTPTGKNAASPLLNVNCRRALADGIDSQRVAESAAPASCQLANGPFPPGSIGYLEDTGYPKYDLDKASAEMDTCLSELGTDSIEFTFNTTNDPFNVETNTLIISMWTEAFGDKVKATITPIEQGQYIGLALTGAFQAFGWRNHGGIDPDQQRLWWQTRVGVADRCAGAQLRALQGPEIDDAPRDHQDEPRPGRPQGGRRGDQQASSASRSTTCGRRGRCGAIITQPYVNGIEANVLPDGGEGVGLAFAGRHQIEPDLVRRREVRVTEMSRP